jgi:hypothetical protein
VDDRRQANPLPSLLEPDEANSGVRHFALHDLLDRPADLLPTDVLLNLEAVREVGYAKDLHLDKAVESV